METKLLAAHCEPKHNKYDRRAALKLLFAAAYSEQAKRNPDYPKYLVNGVHYATKLGSGPTIALPAYTGQGKSGQTAQLGLFDASDSKIVKGKKGKNAGKSVQTSMFRDVDTVAFGVTKSTLVMPIPDDCTIKLALASEDPRTAQQKDIDLQHEAESLTAPMFDTSKHCPRCDSVMDRHEDLCWSCQQATQG